MKMRKFQLPTLLEAKIERYAKDHKLAFNDALIFLVYGWYHHSSQTEIK